MYTPIENVHFANVYGSIEAHLYADLIQKIISDSRAFDGMVRVEPYPFTDDSDFFGIYVDFFPLKPDYDQIYCQLYINIELQRDHISRLKN